MIFLKVLRVITRRPGGEDAMAGKAVVYASTATRILRSWRSS